MSEGYWKGNLSLDGQPPRMENVQRDDAGAPTQEGGGYGNFAATAQVGAIGDAPDAPATTYSSSNPYWQGSYKTHEPSAPETSYVAPGSGTMSARAREAYAAEALRQKDHIAAGLLAIFLGVFGVHKFYLGCNQAGFLMLAVSIIGGIFTFGLAAAVIEVISIIEGVIYLSKSQTEFDRIYVLHQRDWF